MIALLGAGIGVGVLVLVDALRPSAPSLAGSLERLTEHGVAASVEPPRRSLRDRVEAASLRLLGRGDEARTRNLRVTGRTLERHAYEKVLAAVAGSTLTLAVGVVAGSAAPFVVLAAVGGVGGFFYPDLSLRSAAGRARREIRHELSAYLDLVAIVLAGGGGIQTALQSAAAAGEGRGFREISVALDRSRLTGSPAWRELDRTAAELGVEELHELARTLELAGTQGARVGESVSSRADAMRGRLRAELEAEAEAVTERMLLPVAVMLVGLLLFIGFAVVAALGTSSTVVG